MKTNLKIEFIKKKETIVKVKYLDSGLVDENMYTLENILPYDESMSSDVLKLPFRGLRGFLHKPKVPKSSDSLLDTQPGQSDATEQPTPSYETKFGLDTRFTFRDITVNQVRFIC
jgi:hypothetical protein